ncbi:hypothetical protein ACFE04_006007 [Oxalis oulophora]
MRGTLTATVGVFAAVMMMMMVVEEVNATRFTVGSNMGWTTNVNYTVWAQDKHFYNGDWLLGLAGMSESWNLSLLPQWTISMNQMNVLEVNKTDYESCNSDHPLHNWTTGAGRDVVPLNVTRHYYFVSGKGFCYGGMKLAVLVKNPPPPPSASPVKSDSPPRWFLNGGQIVLPAVLAIGAVWDVLLQVMW